MWIRIVRMSLLLLNVVAMGQASLFGVGLFVIANVFCDSGPQDKCFHIGLQFLGTGALMAACVLPAIVALISVRGRLFWYLKVYPFLLVLMMVVAMHWHSGFPVETTRVAVMCGVMAVLTCVYVFLSGSSKVQ